MKNRLFVAVLLAFVLALPAIAQTNSNTQPAPGLPEAALLPEVTSEVRQFTRVPYRSRLLPNSWSSTQRICPNLGPQNRCHARSARNESVFQLVPGRRAY